MAEYINSWLNYLAQWFGGTFPADHSAGFLLAAAIHCALQIQVVAVGALVFIWMERKVSGRIQDRLGANARRWPLRLATNVGRWSEADHQRRHHAGGGRPAPLQIGTLPEFRCKLFGLYCTPFADGWAAQVLNVGVFFVLAVLGLEVFGVILAGYGSGSKWSLFGGMREARASR